MPKSGDIDGELIFRQGETVNLDVIGGNTGVPFLDEWADSNPNDPLTYWDASVTAPTDWEAAAIWPDGLGEDPNDRAIMVGTVAEDAEPGEYLVTPGYAFPGTTIYWHLPVRVIAGGPTLIDRPAVAPETIEDPPGVVIPDSEGIVWELDGDPVEPGTVELVQGVGYTVTAAPADGYAWTPDASVEPVPFAILIPSDDGPPVTITEGGRAVARWLKWTKDAQIEQASLFHYVVTVFVQGYTRGRGFNEAGEPAGPLGAVIISAAARLARNPENLERIQVDNVTESRTVFNGFIFAEMAVLNNYRKRSA